MLETINEIFSQKFFDDFEKVESLLLKYSELVDKIGSKSIKDLGLKELTLATAALTKANTSLNNAYQALNNQSVANAKAADLNAAADLKAAKAAEVRARSAAAAAAAQGKSTAQLTKEQKELTRLTNELTNDYGLLSKAYNDAALRAKNYSLQLGANNPITLEAIAAANKMGDTLKRLDASVGQHQRNVGNYASSYNGLNMSIQQILREAPSAAVSLNTFFLAISNNLPMFFDEIQKIKAAQKAQIAQSKLVQEAAYKEAYSQATNAGFTNSQAKAAGKLAAAESIATAEQLKSAAAARLSAEGSAKAAGANEVQAKSAGDLAAAQSLANATQAKAPSLLAQIGKSIFSINTLLTLAVLALTLFGGKIIDFFKGVGGVSKEAEKANKKYAESLNSISESSRDAAQQDISRINILTKLADDEQQTHRTRMRAIKELQETYPATFGALSQQAILEGKLGDAVNKTTQALLQRAAYQAAEKKFSAASERVYDLTLAQRKAQEDLNKATSTFNALNSVGSKNQFAINSVVTAAQNAQKAQISLTKITENTNKAIQEQQGYLKDAQDYAAKAGDVLFGKDPKAPKDTSARDLKRVQNERDRDRSAEIAAEKELSDAKRDLNNQTLEEQIQGFKLTYENEALAYDDRLTAYGKFTDARQKQILANRDKELADIVELEKQIQAVKNRPEKERSQADNDLILRTEGIATRRKVIEQKTQAEIVELNRKASQEVLRIMETSSDARLKESANTLRIIREQEDDNFRKITKDLGDRLLAGKITLKEYNKEIKKAELKSATDSANAQIAAIEKILRETELSADARGKIEKQLGDLKAKLTDDEVKHVQLTEAEKIALIEKRRDAAINAGAAVIQAAFDIESYRYDKELQNLDEKSRLLDENLKKELAGIEALGLAEEEKEKRIADAKGQAAAAEAAIEQDRRKAIIARARTEKGAKIASIILTTAQAVIQAFAEGDPFTKAVRAAAAGVAGATQLAIAAATPIPTYADGTGDSTHPGGPAIINDNKKYGNEAELIEEPGKTPYWADYKTDTLVNLPKGSSVTPLHKIVQGAQLATMAALSQSGTQKIGERAYIEMVLAQVNAGLAKLDKTIRDKPETRFIGTERGIKAITKQGNSEEERINDITH